MKKFLSTLAIAGAATLALASCNGGSDATTTKGGDGGKTTTTTKAEPTTFDPAKYDFSKIEDKTIKIWVSEIAGIKELAKTQAERYLASLGLEGFTVVAEGLSEGDASSQVLKDSDLAADIYCIASDQLANLVTAKCAVKVWKDFTDTVTDSYDEVGLNAITLGDSYYAYPMTSDNGYVMYYNKTTLAGVDMNSLEDIIAKCESTNTTFCMELENVWYSASFFFGAGCVSSFTTDDSGAFTGFVDTFNSDQGLAALKGMYKLLGSDNWANKSVASEFNQATPASVVVAGSWITKDAKAALGDSYAVAKLPSFTVGDKTYQIGSFSGCKLMCVKPQKSAEKLVLANALAAYLTGEECSKERYDLVQWGPSNKAAQEYDGVKNDEALKALKAQSEFAVNQGSILGAWWTLGNNIAKSAKTTDGSDAALKEVLQTYEDELKKAITLQGNMLVGAWQGWNNTDAESIMKKKGSEWSFTFTIKDDESYKGGRIVKSGSWDTVANYDNVDDASKALLDIAACEGDNGDKNIIFAAGGTYTMVYDEDTEVITITKVE